MHHRASRGTSGARSAVVIPPDHVATIDVVAAPEEEEMVRMGGMLSFTLDNGRVLVAPVVLRALRGEVAVVSDGRGTVSRAPAPKAAAAAEPLAPEPAAQVPALAVLEVPAAFPGRSTRAPLTLRRLDCSYAARSPLNAAAPPAKCITWVTHGSTCIGGCGGRESTVRASMQSLRWLLCVCRVRPFII